MKLNTFFISFYICALVVFCTSCGNKEEAISSRTEEESSTKKMCEYFYYLGEEKVCMELLDTILAVRENKYDPENGLIAFLDKNFKINRSIEFAGYNTTLLTTIDKTQVKKTITENFDNNGIQFYDIYRYADSDAFTMVNSNIVIEYKSTNDKELKELLGEDYFIAEYINSDKDNNSNRKLTRTYLIKKNNDELNIFSASESLRKKEGILYAHPDLFNQIEKRNLPNDPYYDDQWYLNNYGQNYGVKDADIDAPEAWLTTKGDSKVKIALIDDAIDINHPDLKGRFYEAYDAQDGDDDPSPQNPSEIHGTMMAGVMVANHNEIGIAGICPQCELVPIRGIYGGTFSVRKALWHAGLMAQVIVCAWGYVPGTQINQTVLDALSSLEDPSIYVIWALPNYSKKYCKSDISNNDFIIKVGGSTNQEELSKRDKGNCIEFCAPSSGGSLAITTTDVNKNSWGLTKKDYTCNFRGNSASAAIVGGICGLVLSKKINNAKPDVFESLKKSCVKIQSSIAGYRRSDGYSKTHGYGRPNANKALVH